MKMGLQTKIEYCDSTVNPIMGCTGCHLYHNDPGKNHCYAATLCRRRAGQKGWPADFRSPEYFPHRIDQALKWPDLTGAKRPDKPWLNGMPRIIFVNDLGDGFCPTGNYSQDAHSPRNWLGPHLEDMRRSPHVWLLLTKWPANMAYYFGMVRHIPWNFWLGTTICRPGDAHWIGWLRAMRANLWISAEPLLGRIDDRVELEKLRGIRWVAAGGESGANARPTELRWARELRDLCVKRDIPFFWKQWGEYVPVFDSYASEDGFTMTRMGKKHAGRVLDGKLWSQVPDFRRK
jgi:protein gp37